MATSAWLCLLTLSPLAQAQWTHFAATPGRISITQTQPPTLTPTWLTTTDVNDDPISFNGLAGVVTNDTHVYALGASIGDPHLYAFDKHTGAAVWQSPIPAPQLESWSTPAVNNLVVVASADTLTAFDPATGAHAWTTKLPDMVVNASPLLTPTRAFITTFKPFGTAFLVCVDAASGQILWQTPIGAASGSSPALADDIIYITTADAPGRILAFDAGADEAPTPLWSTPNPEPHAFFGAPAITDDAVYAASYSFGPGQLNANLIKLDRDGNLLWSTPSGRTDSTPIPHDDTIILSTGLHGFGALPSIQHFTDHTDAATLDWDSALDSWTDTNANGAIDDGEYLSIGGWTHQPIRAGDTLIVGTIADTFDPYTDIRVIDLTRHPAEPEFVIDHHKGAGTTPAIDPHGLYTIGAGGLVAFVACAPDCNGDNVLNVLDFVCFQQRFTDGDPRADCNDDGALNVLDFVCYQQLFVKGCAP